MKRERVILWVAAAMTVVLIVCVLHPRKPAVVATQAPVAAPAPQPQVTVTAKKPAVAPTVYLVLPKQVLATVDGVPITLGDLIPVHPGDSQTSQQMDSTTYQYLLQRAINRILIMKAAQARGIVLDDSQMAQLQKYQAEREQPEPGLIAKVNVDEAQIQFEMQDQQAFMLQTSLMAANGYSPDVSSDQVQQYYQQHISQYGQLPDDPSARQAAWATIEYQIRETLANSVRTQYQQQLDTYMNQLKSSANVVVNPPVQAQGGVQSGA